MEVGAGSLWHWVTGVSVGVGWSWSEKKGRGAESEPSYAPGAQLPGLRG